MKNTKHIIPIVLGILAIALSFCSLRKCDNKPETETVTDTVTVERVDTLYDTATLIQFFPKPIHDTILRWDYIPADTLLPLVSKTYSDTITEDSGATVEYTAHVSGYNPNLDTLRFRLTYPVITTEITNTVTNTELIYKKQSKLGFGASVGFGYGFFSKQPDIYAGVGLTYRF